MAAAPSNQIKATSFFIFLWIVLCNIIVIAFRIHPSWPFFMSAALYFMLPGDDVAKKMQTVLIGGVTGLLLALLFVKTSDMLIAGEMPILLALMLPLTVVLFLLIIVHLYYPIVLNNVGFVYLIIALMDHGSTATETIPNICSLLAGGLVINGGAVLICIVVKSWYAKHAVAGNSD